MSRLRLLVLGLSGIETLGLVVLVFGVLPQALSSDPLARNIAIGMLVAILIPLAIAATSLFLALRRRWLPLALAMSLVVIATAYFLYRNM
jgi:hypothetical protein